MLLDLPPASLALLEAAEGHVVSEQRASDAELARTCEAHGYAMHAAVASYEAAYGGLVIPDEPGQPEDEPVWLFGAHACLSSGAHVSPRGGQTEHQLVPVVYSPNDLIFFLDEQGRAWAQDTIEDPAAELYADDGRGLVTRILEHFFGAQPTEE